MTEQMSDYLERIETWIEEVEDPEKDVSDYDFLDQLVHRGEDGNNGLANVGAYLAITEEEGEIKVDEGLLEELDERQAGTGYGGRKRFSNIVKEGDTKKRDGKTLYEKEVDGHQFLREMVQAYRQNGDLDSLPPNNESILKGSTQNPKYTNSKGGDRNMTNHDLDHAKRTLKGAKDKHIDATQDLSSAIDTAVNALDYVDDLENERDDIEGDYLETLRAFQSYVDQHRDEMQDMGYNVDQIYSRLSKIDLHGSPSDVGLQDNLRNPGF